LARATKPVPVLAEGVVGQRVPDLVQQMQSGLCHLTYGFVVLPVGYGQVRTATQLQVLTMVCGYSQWASAVLTRFAEDLYAGWWQHLSTLGRNIAA
jgi:hypothetical protein